MISQGGQCPYLLWHYIDNVTVLIEWWMFIAYWQNRVMPKLFQKQMFLFWLIYVDVEEENIVVLIS